MLMDVVFVVCIYWIYYYRCIYIYQFNFNKTTGTNYDELFMRKWNTFWYKNFLNDLISSDIFWSDLRSFEFETTHIMNRFHIVYVIFFLNYLPIFFFKKYKITTCLNWLHNLCTENKITKTVSFKYSNR